jgi:hypothetical protein
MKKIYYAMVFLITFSTCLRAEIGDLNEFKSVQIGENGYIVTFRNEGVRFNYKIDNGDRKVSVYGESVKISNSQAAEFSTRGLQITFLPIEPFSGSFSIKKEIDLRSMGGGLIERIFNISNQAGEIKYGEVTILEK